MTYAAGRTLTLAIMLSLGASSAAAAAVWSVDNAGPVAVALRCEGTTPWLETVLVLDVAELAPGATLTHDWTAAAYNDGLGLNPAAWQCSVVTAGETALGASVEFAVGNWDASVTLAVRDQDGKPRLLNLTSPGAVAQGDPAPEADSTQ